MRPVFTSHRLVLRVPTNGALRLNFQYAQCLLVIDLYYVCLLMVRRTQTFSTAGVY